VLLQATRVVLQSLLQHFFTTLVVFHDGLVRFFLVT
jgi:hypothetical protein